MSDRAARLALAVVSLALVLGCASVSLPGLSQGQFWGDGATYYTMAWSLAEDMDLRYEARDVARVRREFASGPQGIFLKRTGGGLFAPAHDERDRPIYFAKAYLYPLVAAPFVRVLGTRGLLVTNALALSATLWLAWLGLRRRHGNAAALALTLAVFLCGVAPLYLLWPTPELVTMALVAAGLVAWAEGWPLSSAVLLGLAVYAKPYNLLLTLPLGLQPLVEARFRWPGWVDGLRRAAVTAVTVVLLFAVNVAITGELNYQGGERKTFYGTFPFERDAAGKDVTFGNSGQWMTTDTLGPSVQGVDHAAPDRRTGPARAAGEMSVSFVRNLGYFWVGRFGGAVPYFLPAALALLLFLAGPRDLRGGLALAALAASWLFYIRIIPDNWYGGGGTVGNRYFLNLLPLALFLVPAGRAWWVAVPSAAWAATALLPLLTHPMAHSLRPGDHTLREPFRRLPPELTMLNDLAIFTETWRKKQPVGDTEGDPHLHWPADPKAYYLYFLGRGTRGLEQLDGRTGFRLCGDGTELVVRALEPVERLKVDVAAPSRALEVDVRAGRGRQQMTVRSGELGRAVLEPGPGFPYYDTWLYRVRIRAPEAGPGCDVFVSIVLDVTPRPGR